MLTCPEDLHSHDTGPAFLEFALDRNDFLWRSIQGRTERIDALKGDLNPIQLGSPIQSSQVMG